MCFMCQAHFDMQVFFFYDIHPMTISSESSTHTFLAPSKPTARVVHLPAVWWTNYPFYQHLHHLQKSVWKLKQLGPSEVQCWWFNSCNWDPVRSQTPSSIPWQKLNQDGGCTQWACITMAPIKTCSFGCCTSHSQAEYQADAEGWSDIGSQMLCFLWFPKEPSIKVKLGELRTN